MGDTVITPFTYDHLLRTTHLLCLHFRLPFFLNLYPKYYFAVLRSQDPEKIAGDYSASARAFGGSEPALYRLVCLRTLYLTGFPVAVGF